MKIMKRIAALLLALCILIGMPFAVSATDEFRITKAVEVSYNVMDWDNVTWSGSVNGTNFWNQDKYKGRMIAVYFNQDIPEDAGELFTNGHLGGKICAYSGETLKDTMTAFYLGINTVEDALLFGIGTQITSETPYGRTFDIMRSDNTSKFGAAHAKGATSFKLFLYDSCDGYPRNSILKCFNNLTDGTGSNDHIMINGSAVDTVECEIVQDVLKVDKMVALPDRMAVNPEKNSTLLVVFNQNVQNLVAGKTIDTTKHEFKYCVLVKDKASGSVIRSDEYGSLVPDEGFSKGNVLGFKMQNAARFFDYYETTWLSGKAAYSEVVGYEVLIYDKEKPNTTYVDYIVSSETGKELFTDQPSATVDLYRTNLMLLSSTVELPLKGVEPNENYQATLKFEQPVTINDVSKILLVDGDKTFAGKEIVSGNGTTAVTVAFDGGAETAPISKSAGIRITDSVENFILEKTIVIDGNDKLIMYDETTVITGFCATEATIDAENQVAITFNREIALPNQTTELLFGIYDKTTNALAVGYETTWRAENFAVDGKVLTASLVSAGENWYEDTVVLLETNENYELRLWLADSVGNQDGKINGLTTADGVLALNADAVDGDSMMMVPSMESGNLEVRSISIVDEDVIRVTFNKTVKDYTGTFAQLRFMDENLANNQTLYYTINEGRAVDISTAGGSNRLAFMFPLTMTTTDNKTFTLAFNSDSDTFKKQLTVRNMSETFRLFEQVASQYSSAKWVLAFGEGGNDAVKGNGLIDSIVAKDGAQMLSTNKQYSDVHVVELTQSHLTIDPEPLTLKKNDEGYSIKQIGKSTLEVYFNRPITLVDMSGDTAPVVALRIMDHNGNGVVIDGISQVVGSTGQVPQWNATEVKVDEADSTKMIVSFGDLDISLILKELTMPQHLSAAGDVAFFFEERNPGVTEQGDTYVGNNHLIHHIRDAVTGKQFDITEFTTHNYAHIIDFDIQYMDPAIDEVTIDDVKVINQSQIVVTFSEQVVIDNATIEKMPVAIIQLVDDIYGYKRTDDGVIWGWKGYLNYYNDAHTQLVFSLLKDGNANLPMPGLDDIAALMDEQYDRMVLGIVDNNANDGVVNAINTTTGHRLLADPFNGRADIVYCEVDVDQIPQGELTIINAEAISDMDIILTFSDAVSIEDNPFLAIRMYNEKNLLLYKTSNGEYVTRGTTDGVKNTPMQWSMSWEWCDEKHTQIKCKITSTPGLTPNLTEMFNHDWEKEYAGCKIWIGFEENNASLVAKNSYVDNITLASNSGVSLTGNVWTADGKRAGAFISITPGYTIKKVTASAKILNDTDIRITFSAPVDFIGEPYMGVRLVEEGYNLIKLGDEYNVVYMQYSGKWTWEDDSHTSILWRMNGDGAGGANNLADVVNYKNVLRMLKGKRITFCIEEKTTNNVISAKANGLIDNILAKDKQNHLTVNKPSTNGYDGLYMDLNTGLLKDRAELELLSVKAIDDQTVELTFSEAVFLAEGELAPTLVIQYLNKSGNTETFTDGRTASFNGTISYKDNTKTVLVWKLNSKQTKSLTSVFNFEDNLKWNFGARIVFVVSDAKDNAMPSKCGLINGITSLDGVRRLSCNIGSGKIQRDIEVSYDLPERITDVGTDKNKDTIEYVSNYAVYMIVAIVTVVIVSVAALCVKPKKKEEK